MNKRSAQYLVEMASVKGECCQPLSSGRWIFGGAGDKLAHHVCRRRSPFGGLTDYVELIVENYAIDANGDPRVTGF